MRVAVDFGQSLILSPPILKEKAARTGNMPGVTRGMETRVKILDDPPVYIIDTPGRI